MTAIGVDGFTGMRYDLWGKRNPGECLFIQNMYPANAYGPSPLVPRPGVVSETVTGATGDVQALLELTLSATGLLTRVAIIGGEIWKNSSTGAPSWSRVITSAQLTAASITVASGRVHVLDYNGSLIVADNSHQPWAWDGTSGGGLTLLSNAPSTTVGAPTVYYGKLFFIKSGNTLVWSEENAANTGYEAGGYNNSWDLKQTTSAKLTAILGTNAALYYWRDYSVGYIEGAVTPDFSTTGTDDGISDIIGTGSSWSVAYDGQTVFFMDRLRRPYAIRGRTAIPLWQAVADLYTNQVLPFETSDGAGTGMASMAQSQAYYYNATTTFAPATGHVLFFLGIAFNGDFWVPGQCLAYHAETLACHGVWHFGRYSAWAVGTRTVSSGNKPYRSLMMGPYVGTGNQSYVAFMGDAELQSGMADSPTSSTSYPGARVITEPLGWSGDTILSATRVDVTASIKGTASAYHKVKCRVLTPDTPSDHGTAAPSYQTASLASKATMGNTEQRTTFGVTASGRWVAADVSFYGYTTGDAAAALQGLQLHAISIEATKASREPNRR